MDDRIHFEHATAKGGNGTGPLYLPCIQYILTTLFLLSCYKYVVLFCSLSRHRISCCEIKHKKKFEVIPSRH